MNQSLSYEIAAVMPAAIATGLFVSLCTIQSPSGTVDAAGAPDGLYNDVAGLVAIPCVDAVPSEARIQATEMKTLADVLGRGLRHCTLDGYYPAILIGWRQGWRAVVDGTTYDILGAEPDSQATQTRLQLQQVTL